MLSNKCNESLQYHKIDEPLSVYLDLVRFMAAVAVFMGHAVQDGIYDGDLILHNYSHEAVIVFFVMSGFVIANTASRPEENLRTFVVARASRIYSVAIPALALGYICKGAVSYIKGGEIFDDYMNFDIDIWLFLRAFFFLNESWLNFREPPWNKPYWSLCYEVMYYCIFGIFLFLRGKKRWFLLIIFSLVAGPRVLILLPLWMLGVALSQYKFKRLEIAWPGLALLFGSLALIWIIHISQIDITLRSYLHHNIPGFWRLSNSQRFITDYVLAILFVVNLIGFSILPEWITHIILLIRSVIKYLAGVTFSIYLFHRPLTKAATELLPNHENSFWSAMLILLIISLIILFLGEFTERRKHVFRRIMDKLLPT